MHVASMGFNGRWSEIDRGTKLKSSSAGLHTLYPTFVRTYPHLMNEGTLIAWGKAVAIM